MKLNELVIAVKGAGDLATGLAWRLYKAKFHRIYLMEVEQPLAVRRSVAFCEAVYDGEKTVEGVTAVRVDTAAGIRTVWEKGRVPVRVDPRWASLAQLPPDVVVDAILAKKNLGTRRSDAPLVIGLGPGFTAGSDVHRVIETQRGHHLGRVLHIGQAVDNTGVPGTIAGFSAERVLRAPADGVFTARCKLGEPVRKGDLVGMVHRTAVTATLDGILRGLIRSGVPVQKGLKLGDIDPRGDVSYCTTISDKARALGGAVLEAICEKYNH